MHFLILLVSLIGQIDMQPEAPSHISEKKAVFGQTMMVASANPIASQVGFSILEKGGNALDATIAMQMVLNVVEPQSSGIGGGGFLLYYDKKEGEVFAYDGRETAPCAVELGHSASRIGGESVGVPGVLRMLELAHQEHGSLNWKELFDPAILIAERGFSISSRLHTLIKRTTHLKTFPQTRSYLFERDRAKKVGTQLKNPALAQVFHLLANEGTRSFYEGEIAHDIVQTVQGTPVHPGKLSYEDLVHYKPIKRKPIVTDYHSYRVFGFPPPSSGGIAVAQILGMLGQLNFNRYALGSSEFINLFCKASRAAFAVRQLYVADPAFTNVPVNHLLNSHYLQHLLDNPIKTPISALEHPSTTQICIVDREGNAVSYTSSIEHAFGSTLMVRGFFLNNQLTDFSSGPNRAEPGKRPMSSMAPTLVFEGDQLILTLGSAGGSRIIDYVTKTLFGVLDFELNIQEAISFPNYTCLKETIDLEKGTFLKKDVQALQMQGNRVRIIPLTSGTQGIQITPHYLIGGVDPRREGLAIGN